MGGRPIRGLAGWAWVAAIMGFARSLAARHHPKPGTGKDTASVTGGRLPRAALYANEAVLPFYLLHEPVIVAAAWLIVRWHAPITGKYAALVIVSFAATLAVYETLVRRFRVIRLLVGTSR
jgi:glucan biosynthesis protein C